MIPMQLGMFADAFLYVHHGKNYCTRFIGVVHLQLHDKHVIYGTQIYMPDITTHADSLNCGCPGTMNALFYDNLSEVNSKSLSLHFHIITSRHIVASLAI